MESDICQILFYVLAFFALVCAVAVVCARNPVNSAMNMTLCFGMVAGILFIMGAQFLGIVQLVVYLGAILVLFLFITMMLDVKAEERSLHNMPAAIAGVVVAAILAGVVTKAACGLPGAQELRCPAKSLCTTLVEDLSLTPKAADEAPARPALYGGPLPRLADSEANPQDIPDTKLLAGTLFTRYNQAFVILSFALFAGTVGAIALSRKLKD